MRSISRSSSSGVSSLINDGFITTLTLQTALDIPQVDVNIRTIFCGEQDCRLNELRQMTGAIIDLNLVQDTRRPFERVNWTISHRNPNVREFVARRLNYWAQQTTIACDMAHDDVVFLQQQQHRGKQTKKAPPLSAANFGRRNRTRSLTQSSNTHFNLTRDSVPSTPSGLTHKYETPFTGLLGRTLMNTDTRYPERERLFTPQVNRHRTEDRYSSCTTENIELTPIDFNQLLESAKSAGVLSDTSEYELNENRVCFADTVSVGVLAELLRNHELQSTSDIYEIDHVIQQSRINLTNREQIRRFHGKIYWFHRVLLNNHIQFPPGISQDANQARQLAYRQMIDVCLNENGIKMIMLTDNRVKVMKGLDRKCHNTNDMDMNATYISKADLSCLSHYKMEQ